MIKIPSNASPKIYTRLAGVLGLMILAGAIFAEGVRGIVIIPGDAATTSANILNSATLYRSGLAIELLMLCCDIAYTLLLYILLRPAGLNIARLAILFRIITLAVLAGITVFHIGAALVLEDSSYLSAFSAAQLEALAFLSIKMHVMGYHIALAFFAFHVLLIGVLVIKSRYLPKLIGYMLIVAAICYAVSSFSNLLDLGFADKLFPLILLPPLIAETSLTLWLLVKGVNEKAWQQANNVLN